MKALPYLLLTTLLYFSASVSAQTPPTSLSALIKKDVTVQTFSGLNIKGPINVTLVSNQDNPAIPPIQIFGDPQTVAAVIWKIKNNTLYLDTKWTHRPHSGDKLTIRVNIAPSQLKQIDFNSSGCLLGKGLTGSLALTTHGNGGIALFGHKLDLTSLITDGKTTISLHGIDSTALNIQGKNTGNIKIEGNVGLNTIDLKGNGTLKVYWASSPDLKIRLAGKEKVLLAGVAQTLEAHLSDNSQLFAQQLRAKNGFIKTKHQASANVTVTQNLTAKAQDKSTIYYSKPVLFANTFVQNTGLVLSR